MYGLILRQLESMAIVLEETSSNAELHKIFYMYLGSWPA
jgi:hypothetical protein